MKLDEFSAKHFNQIEKEPKRPNSLLKNRKFPAEVFATNTKTSTPTCIGSRLVQKRKSIERKIENMRKLKLEAEMKEVQSKPKISTRSRKLAMKAEVKLLGDKKTENLVQQKFDEEKLLKNFEKPEEKSKIVNEINKILEKNDVADHNLQMNKILSKDNFFSNDSFSIKISKVLIVEDLHDLEEEIKLLEKCLSIESPLVTPSEIKDIQFSKTPTETSKKFPRRISIIEKAKSNNRVLAKSPCITPNSSKNLTKTPKNGENKPFQKIPAQRFIKKPLANKQKSNSMDLINQLKFNYRSLSPFHIQITRYNENY